ncbi:MAG TPA: twin transmembrane helix small protein [Methyloceanibacter sp.]|nr:twin transmembrane helix small protein [Methyloceanibacter sp.]
MDLAKLVYFAIPLALGAVAIVLALGLWNMVARPRPEVSQTLMRWRVALQFIALCLIMAALYLSARS